MVEVKVASKKVSHATAPQFRQVAVGTFLAERPYRDLNEAILICALRWRVAPLPI